MAIFGEVLQCGVSEIGMKTYSRKISLVRGTQEGLIIDPAEILIEDGEEGRCFFFESSS